MPAQTAVLRGKTAQLTTDTSPHESLKFLILRAIADPEFSDSLAADPIAAANSIGLSDEATAALRGVDQQALAAGFKELSKLLVSTGLDQPSAHLSWS